MCVLSGVQYSENVCNQMTECPVGIPAISDQMTLAISDQMIPAIFYVSLITATERSSVNTSKSELLYSEHPYR